MDIERYSKNTEAIEPSESNKHSVNSDSGEQKQFVTFVIDKENFAIDMDLVHEIVRVPETVHVPLAPPSIRGLANLRGRVLPIISLRSIFGMDDTPVDDAMRVVIVEAGQPVGFVVDRVSSVINVSSSQIESAECIDSTVSADLLKGVIKGVGGYSIVMVVDFEKVVNQEFSGIDIQHVSTHKDYGCTEEGGKQEDVKVREEFQLVSFEINRQKYAIDIENIQEIVLPPEKMTRMPRCASHVEGVITLRNHLLPVLSLRAIFNMPPQEVDEKTRIVVVSNGNTCVGLMVDSVSEVLRISRSDVEAVPGLLTQSSNLAEISGMCRPHGDSDTVCIVSIENLLSNSTVKEAIDSMETAKKDAGSSAENKQLDSEGDVDEQMVVVFNLSGEEFGVHITHVQEIVRIPDELTHVPRTPAFVEGVINLRGSVLPVIDMRRKMGLLSAERTDRQRIMVFVIDRVRVGFIVDSVTEVLKIPRGCIEESPKFSPEQSRVISKVANIREKKRIIQILNPSHLIEDTELVDLTSSSQEGSL